MKTCLTYGVGLALASSIFNYIMFFLGYHADPEKLRSGQTVSSVVGILLTIVFVYLGIRAVRENAPDRSLTYGRGVGSAALIGVFSGIAGAILMYIYGTVVNPDYHDLLYEAQMLQAEQRGVPADQLQAMEGMMRFFSGPVFISAMAVIFSPLITTIVGLIVSAFLKRKPPEPVEAAG